MNKIYLNVPFFEKEEAKKMGASWDSSNRRWYITEDQEQSLFRKWIKDKPSASVIKKETNKIINKDNKKQDNFVSLSSLLQNVSNVVSNAFPQDIWVKAEVSEYNDRGNIFLKLTESVNGKEVASTNAVIFQNNRWFINSFYEKTGLNSLISQEVLLKCQISFNQKYGLSISINGISEEFTLGSIEKNIQNILNNLQQEGIIKNNQNLQRNWFFNKVAVISPKEAASLADFKTEASVLENNNICNFVYFEAIFQGDNTEKSILNAINNINFEEYDCLVIIRGGGSKIDLNYLNNYLITKSICECPIPVLTGIGHEIDNTTLDYVSNIRFDTPSKVIKYIETQNFNVILDFKKMHERNTLNFKNKTVTIEKNIENIYNRIASLSSSKISNKKLEIEHLNNSIKEKSIGITTKLKESLLYFNFKDKFNNKLSNTKHVLENIILKVVSNDPKKIIQKGFCVLSKDGGVITSTKDVLKNETYNLKMKDGEIKIKREGE